MAAQGGRVEPGAQQTVCQSVREPDTGPRSLAVDAMVASLCARHRWHHRDDRRSTARCGRRAPRPVVRLSSPTIRRSV